MADSYITAVIAANSATEPGPWWCNVQVQSQSWQHLVNRLNKWICRVHKVFSQLRLKLSVPSVSQLVPFWTTWVGSIKQNACYLNTAQH